MSIAVTIAGIVFPSILLIVAVRRWVAALPWRMGLLFLGMTLLFLRGAVFTSQLPVPLDEVARGYPYRGAFGDIHSRNPLTNDSVKLFLPWMQVAREELFHFRAPLWNRYSFSGYPLLANGESAPFSPFFLATLFVPLPKQIVAMAGLKIFVSLLFTYLYARSRGTSEWAAAFAATVFSWSVFQVVFLYYSTTAVTALLPAALLSISLARERDRYRDIVFVALVVAALLANGHPESVLHVAVCVAGVLVIDFALTDRRGQWMKTIVRPIAGVFAGLALSAPAWVPVLEQVFLSNRLTELRGGIQPPYPIAAIWAMVAPNAFGNPVRGNWSWIMNYSLVASSYVGLVVLVLLCAGAVAWRAGIKDRLLLLFAIGCWLIAMGWSPLGEMVARVPPFSITANDKLRFVALFLGGLLAARALDRIGERRAVAGYYVSGAILVALSLYVHVAKRQLVRPSDWIGMIVVVLLAAVITRFPRHATMAGFVLIAIELFVLNSSFNALVSPKFDRPLLPIFDAIRKLQPKEPFRIAGYDWMFLPNASAQYGLEDIRGSDPMSFATYVRALSPIVLDDRSIDFDRIVVSDHRLFDVLNVRFLLTEPGADPGGRWRLVYQGMDGRVFENPTMLQRFFVREGDADLGVRMVSPQRFRLTVHARTPVLIGSSQVAALGWRVKRGEDEIPVEAVEGSFIGFRLPAGESRIQVLYRPRAYWGMLPVSALAVLALAFGAFRGARAARA